MRVWNALTDAVKREGRTLRAVTLNQWVQALGGSWCLLVSALLLTQEGKYTENAFAQDVSWTTLGLALLLGLLVLALLNRLLPRLRAEGYVFVFGVLLTCFLLAVKATTYTKFYLYYALAAVLAVVLFYAAAQGLLTLPFLRPGRIATVITLGAIFLSMAAVLGLVGALRYITYNTPNFDFGIFSHMFHHMRESFLPLTTCERDRLLSHFAVHISPIYYVLLPFYAVFPTPVTLAIGQGVVIASGVIPLYLLGRKFGLSNKLALLLAFAYTTYPALSCGTLYDLHENCFLAPLLLWMFYFCESRRPVWLAVSVALVLMVKEDAAVYVALFAVFWMLEQREVKKGVWMLGAAVLYFCTAVFLIDYFGDGTLVGRYANLQYEDGGLVSMVKTLVVNPGLFLETALSPVDGTEDSKLRYLAQLMVPLGLALFTTRRLPRYLLLLPVLLNILSCSVYQFNLSFQYSFGISAFFFYLCLLNLRDLPPMRQKPMVSYMAAAGVLLYTLTFAPQIESNLRRYEEKGATYQQLTAILETVPADASVTCSTFLLPHLAQRDVVYEDYYHKETDTDYLVLDLRPGYRGHSENSEQRFAAAGYVEVLREEELVLIMKRGE